jgi:hypothetical protein
VKRYSLEGKDFTHPPHDKVSLTALGVVAEAGAEGAKNVDIGRAVAKVRGRRSTGRNSNVAQGMKVMDSLSKFGLVESFYVRAKGSDKHFQYRWRVAAPTV